MKKLCVLASLYYNYTVDVPDNFDFNNEADLQNYIADRDPLQFEYTSVSNPSGYINSVFDDETDELLYNWD